MEVTMRIPDDVAQRLIDAGASDLSQLALESLAADQYRSGHLTKAELQRMLKISTGIHLDGFLEERGIYEEYTVACWCPRLSWRSCDTPVFPVRSGTGPSVFLSGPRFAALRSQVKNRFGASASESVAQSSSRWNRRIHFS